MINRYETRTRTNFKKLVSFFLFWILLSSVCFANESLLQESKQYAQKLYPLKKGSNDLSTY